MTDGKRSNVPPVPLLTRSVPPPHTNSVTSSSSSTAGDSGGIGCVGVALQCWIVMMGEAPQPALTSTVLLYFSHHRNIKQLKNDGRCWGPKYRFHQACWLYCLDPSCCAPVSKHTMKMTTKKPRMIIKKKERQILGSLLYSLLHWLPAFILLAHSYLPPWHSMNDIQYIPHLTIQKLGGQWKHKQDFLQAFLVNFLVLFSIEPHIYWVEQPNQNPALAGNCNDNTCCKN